MNKSIDKNNPNTSTHSPKNQKPNIYLPTEPCPKEKLARTTSPEDLAQQARPSGVFRRDEWPLRGYLLKIIVVSLGRVYASRSRVRRGGAGDVDQRDLKLQSASSVHRRRICECSSFVVLIVHIFCWAFGLNGASEFCGQREAIARVRIDWVSLQRDSDGTLTGS